MYPFAPEAPEPEVPTVRVLQRTTHPIARADYECDLCHEEIPKGARYRREEGFIPSLEGYRWTLRMCEDEEACQLGWPSDEWADEARKAGAGS